MATAPAGTWASIRWIKVGHVLPQGMSTFGTPAVFGWSRGYVAFAFDGDGTDEHPTTHLLTSHSRDGLRWSTPKRAAMPSSVEYEGAYAEPVIGAVREGPSGLLAVGWDGGGTCGPPPPTYDALWSSTDGVTWRPVTLPPGWTTSIVPVVDGGSSGYIAGAMDSNHLRRMWTSTDGRRWHALRMPTSSRGRVEVDDATSFAGGYVLVGAFLNDGGCGGPSLSQPSVWWSPNGRWWARIPLGPALAGPNHWISVYRLSDHEVVATVDSGTQDAFSWVSTDGRRWSYNQHSRTDFSSCVLTDGHRSLCVDTDRRGRPSISWINPNLSERIIRQRAPGPVSTSEFGGTYQVALGPTGLLAVDGETGTAWIGVPSTR